ncbi:Phosphate-binding protein PstS precursor [Aquisphaera giovannonii]|uniref:Phosphate-binding protein n=1 Tax=Aquisphaera giovannonii TaxID=406548 RepID=A0A5B9W9E1_9BACT|nr:PstS family phosphate ABC transporter substrate-binding protein [Aquisphaera giovannonii]QEH36884.1 Phosphate-binding protein PstS precursor [Aquisphaera giovannonii]
MRSMRLKAAGILSLASLLAGCGGGDEAGSSGPGGAGAPRGTVEVDGSSTVFRISRAAQEAFESVNPNTTVVVNNHGTGGGFGRYLQGEVDIVDASRDAKPDEESKAKAQGIDWTRFTVGNDGITVVVNPKNTFVQSLSVEQLRKLWQPGSTVKTWKDLDPNWPDRQIRLYSPDNDSGTYEFFVEAIVGKPKAPAAAPASDGQAKAAASKGQAATPKGQRDDVQQSADDNTLVNGVSNDEDGIGYFGYAYYAANKERLRPVAVQNGPEAKPVLPSAETIADKSYRPLSRPLFIFVKNSAAKRPEVKQFLNFYLDNVKKLSVDGGYDPPTDDDLKANQQAAARLYGAAEPAAKP